MEKLKHIFGPVPSRRLGRSLGIDLVPYKVCSFDCIYCQLGKTTRLTTERKEYIPFDEIYFEIEQKFSNENEFDYVTLSGSGEPTLHSRIGEVVSALKKFTDKPVAILTNGSMLWQKEVRESIASADLVVPSLDAGTEEIFMKVNRPVPGLDFETIKKGIADFIKEFNGKTWLEVFILKGLSDTKEQIEKMAEFTRIASPDRVQLNTTARPACEKFALPVSHRKMVEIKKAFPEPVEIIADFSKPDNIKSGSLSKDILINLLSRRPCTATDISKSLGAHYNEVIKLTEQLTRNKTIESEEKNGKIFYKSVKNA